METTEFYDSKKIGQLVTQVNHSDMPLLQQMMVDKDLDLEALLVSDNKANRTIAKKCACLMMFITTNTQIWQRLVRLNWGSLLFRKAPNGQLAVEVVPRRKRKR